MTMQERFLLASDIALAFMAGLFIFFAIVALWGVWQTYPSDRKNRLWGGFFCLIVAAAMITVRWVVYGHWGF